MINRIDAECQRAITFQQKDIDRAYRNWGVYSGVESKQWDPDDVKKLSDQDRQAAQFNISTPKVDTLTGSLIAEKWDVDFKPAEGNRTSLTEAPLETYYSDKELCNYQKHIADVIKDGLVISGDLEMTFSRKFSPMGNICFRRCQPGFLVRDPHWRSDDDSECEKAWQIFHLSALTIHRLWPHIKSPLIESALQHERKYGDEYMNTSDNFNDQLSYETKGNLYRVIKYHWMETLSTTRIMGQKMNSNRWYNFPITKNKDILKEFMFRNKINPESMIPHNYEDKIHYVAIICPQITNTQLLAKGVSKIQCKRLPFFHFTVDRSFGKDKGIIDDVIDLQRTINKRESKITDMISTATGGGKIVNWDLFKKPEERTKFLDHGNDPNYIGWGDGDEMTKDRAMIYLNSNQFPSTLVDQLQRMYDVVNVISKVPAAMAAMTEGANESGILYERKLQIAQLGTLILDRRVEHFYKTVMEAYLEQWPLAYKGLSREFSTRDGKHKIVLNKKVFNEAEGRYYIQNRPEEIPRCSVIITKAVNSPTNAMRKQAFLSELYNLATKANQVDDAEFLWEKILDTADWSDEDKAEFEELKLMKKIKRYKRMEADISNLDASSKQAMLISMQSVLQMQQLTAPPPQPQISEIPEEEIPQPVEMQQEESVFT